jgi:hypothetical protein
MAIRTVSLTLAATHFDVGDYVEHSWFRGTVVAQNPQQFHQFVRVDEVIRPAVGRTLGSIQRVPYNAGRLSTTPADRNKLS